MTSLDSYVTLGRSGLRVSPIGLGAMTFGEDHGWGASVETSETILSDYLERGGNLIDTANAYTNGHSEKIIGDYFARSGRRDRVVLSTKFLSNLFPGDPNGGGGGRKAMIGQLHESLRRLQTDYVDLYWLHGWDRGAPIDETLRALDDMVTAGKVRYICPTYPRGLPRRPRPSPGSAAGRRSQPCSWNTPCSSGPRRANWCRWRRRWVSG
jgi:aryl-alcohol dehydrogenase-like predicted oxidoreductase